MNQQRGRRFRSAKEAEVAESKARDRGEQLPTGDRFDSNCITPGTEFMTRLHAQLKYFVSFKVSTDRLWQKVKVILSGHECPGEGEHKIMDYIRYMKSQPDYNPNTRHCLYGLDADLIMLGLCTHEPHFSLLREEVKYGRKNNQKRIPTPEETTFFLLHLSLMREYLDLEFQQLKNMLSFPYDLECIIDDWVLMGFLVGNDFIPHLPDMHINRGALPLLYRTYIDVLPTLEGYINEGGSLRLDRFEKYMEKLAAFDMEQFKDVSADLRYIEGKTGRKMAGPERHRHSYKNSEKVPPPPSKNEESSDVNKASLNNKSPFEEPSMTKNKDLAALIASTDELLEMSDDGDENYTDIDSDEDDDELTAFAEFCAHKKNYYMEKLEYEQVTPEVLRSQAEGYVRAIQWNLNYYYNGCCSWSWFYPHHYAPYISDIKNFANLKLNYDLGQPFLPFQQLLAVLPSASQKLLPQAYHDLMVNDSSPIIQFYPTEFKTDLNGKRQDWEAVVLIPFIEQVSLLKAMDSKENELTDEEKSRNKHGPMQVYSYTTKNLGSYMSPAYFPALANHHAREENVYREQLYVDPSRLIKGLCPGVQLNVYCLGFPTLRHIPFTAELHHAKVKVFESPSQGDNMLLTLLPQGKPKVSAVGSQLLGRSIYVNWPHMFEARVVAVSGQRMRLQLNGDDTITTEPFSEKLEEQWNSSMNAIKEKYSNRMGIDVGKTEILVYACTLEDKKFIVVDGKCDIECVKQWARFPIGYALQTTLADIEVYDPIEKQAPTVEDLLPMGATVFILESGHYGCKGSVVDVQNHRVKVSVEIYEQPKLDAFVNTKKGHSSFMPGHALASKLSISPHLLSRITGTIFIKPAAGHESERKLNIGLNLKFNKRNEEVCGYTRRDKNNFWMYSSKTENELHQYLDKFPEVFNILMNNGADDLLGTDLYPSDTEEKLAQLSEFLKGLESGKTERQTCGAQVLDEETVLELESMVDKHLRETTVCKDHTLFFKPSFVYRPKPKLGQAPDAKAVYRLFDRVVNVRESHTVPIGAYGTIIGIHDADKGPQAMYDVLMDKEFLGGIKLRCSANRGYRLPAQAMINITYGTACEASRRSGKPTAVVGPSAGTVEDGHYQKVYGVSEDMHSSAFASWGIIPNQESEGSSRQGGSSKRNQTNVHTATPFGNPLNNNPNPRDKTQQLSSEYLEMLQQLQKSGSIRNSKSPQSSKEPSHPLHKSGSIRNSKSPQSSKEPSHSLHDSSNALKKMLKIADDSSKRPLPTSSESIMAPRKNTHSYVMQLLSLHQSQGIKLPKYLYGENQDSMIVCTIMLSNGREIQGTPAFTNDQAAENAASTVLTLLALEEPHMLTGPPKHGPLLPPPFTHQPQHTNNRPQWRGSYQAANPSTLPQPPPKWYQTSQGSILPLQPDWRGGPGRFSLPSSSHLQHNHNISTTKPPFMQGPHQANQMPWQNPFIPLQAESRCRQPSQFHHQPHVHTKPHELPYGAPRPTRPHTTRGGPSGRQPPEGAINTGRNTAKPMRSRVAANFSKPFSFADTKPDPK